MKRFAIFIPILLFISLPVFGDTENVHKGYGLIMSNGMKLKIAEYCIDLDRNTITYESALSGIRATFPLERVKKVVQYDKTMEEIPDEAQTLYKNMNSLSDMVDDGGIPILFKVKTITVGSGGSGAYSRSSRSSSGRSGFSGSESRGSSGSSMNIGGESSSTKRFGTSSGRSTNTRSSSSSYSGGSSSADDFFTKIFGGR